MRILYGVVGEGMGHATRSRVILEHLLQAGHELRVVVSGRAHRFLAEKFSVSAQSGLRPPGAPHAGSRGSIEICEIAGLHLRFEGNDLDLSESILSNLDQAPFSLKKNLDVYRDTVRGFDAEVVISDFESWAYFYARTQGLPVISVDNMQVINCCAHDDFVSDDESVAFRIAKLAVKAKLPGAYHYVVSSFFFPPVRKPRTTLVPPILRKEILAARREPGDHVLVYQTSASNQALVPMLKSLPFEFRVYGMGREGQDENVQLRAFSETGFVDDLRTARAVVAGGGYSLMGEAVHLHVPMLSIPIQGQYEQELNARYLNKLGYGAFASEANANVLTEFLARTDEMSHALERYVPRDNAMLFGVVDELLHKVALGEPPPETVEAPALGRYEGKRLRGKLQDIVDEEDDVTNPGAAAPGKA